MNEFIEQFIIESRELVEQANAALLVLEHAPNNTQKLDEIFRAFHTLKGGAGIVEFVAMERAVHALENNLTRCSATDASVSNKLLNDCVACLDQVSRWLDGMEQSGELPADADAQADILVARVDATTTNAELVATIKRDVLPDWASHAVARHPQLQNKASTAVRFTPAADCFFKGQDPLALLASMPGLLCIDIEPVTEWPSLQALDAFESISVFTVLSNASLQETRKHLRVHIAECDVVALDTEEAPLMQRVLPAAARKLLDAQLALISKTESQSFAGRITSAGAVVTNVLRYCGYDADADAIAGVVSESLRDGTPQLLAQRITQLLAVQAAPVAIATDAPAAGMRSRTLRVEAERVDLLVRLTGELTVVKNAIGHAVHQRTHVEAQLERVKQHHDVLEHLVSELQRAVLGMRVLPLRTVLQRFPRVIREMATSLDKPANIMIEGDDTEADKAIVEMLFEPLLHVVRNAMDHGIETPALRAQRNKAQTATIRLRASRQGEHVLVEVSDDGGGVDTERVRILAEQRGLVVAEVLEQMSDDEIADLVFAPGFSTAAKITELSGRGVGMDAVRTAVERIGGRVMLRSQRGLGTTITFTLPFSVMMTHLMSVEAGGQMFGIPLDAVVETLRVPASSLTAVGATKVIVHRNRTVPVCELPGIARSRQQFLDQQEAIIVIATIAGQLGAILVDRLGERMEAMLKPLDGLLSGIPGVAGTTILGDGKVLLVLDLMAVLQ